MVIPAHFFDLLYFAFVGGCIFFLIKLWCFRFINLQVSNLTDKWYGESQKLAAAVFSIAQKLQPTIIFIDEIGEKKTKDCFDYLYFSWAL